MTWRKLYQVELDRLEIEKKKMSKQEKEFEALMKVLDYFEKEIHRLTPVKDQKD